MHSLVRKSIQVRRKNFVKPSPETGGGGGGGGGGVAV